jgi:hypothetical protein
MSIDGHPALSTDDPDLPGLTLVLVGDPGEILAGLARAVTETRAVMAAWVRLFQQRGAACAAGGDLLGQAMARGQVLTGEHVIGHLDEHIIEAFSLWDQYGAQVPGPPPP